MKVYVVKYIDVNDEWQIDSIFDSESKAHKRELEIGRESGDYDEEPDGVITEEWDVQ